MKAAVYSFSTKLWRSSAGAGWFFLTLPKTQSMPIKTRALGQMNAFGSLRVLATIGDTSWNTSIFFDTKAAAFVLPVKADVRRRQSLTLGETVACSIAF